MLLPVFRPPQVPRLPSLLLFKVLAHQLHLPLPLKQTRLGRKPLQVVHRHKPRGRYTLNHPLLYRKNPPRTVNSMAWSWRGRLSTGKRAWKKWRR